jgi:DNA-binding SARP family transcriptional activator
MARLALYLLGPPRIELDGEPVHIGRRGALALLAYLAVTGRLHNREALASLLGRKFSQLRARGVDLWQTAQEMLEVAPNAEPN